MSRPAAARHLVTLLLVVVMALCVVVLVGLMIWSRRAPGVTTAPPPPLTDPDTPAIPQPQVRTVGREGYVGSDRCIVCHEQIHASYQTHPMSRSLAPIGEEQPVEDWEQREFDASPWRRFEVLREDGKLLHAEVIEDDEGEVSRQQEEIAFALGSGRRGRSYLVNHEGILYQSPIGWYSQAGRFGLSPGYEGPGNQHFLRRVGDGCLYCHSGRVSTPEPGSDRYDQRVFFEPAIGCERCHGPGQDHIAFHLGTADGESPAGDPIVNPVKLEPEARDAVCYQCHLQGETAVLRRGKTPFDFRPGDRIEDVWVAFVRAGAERESKAVGQVQQMRSSLCFQQSDGRLGCISCHDPHGSPVEDDREQFYNSRCLTCHESPDACAEEEQTRLAAPASGSCIDCHMPAREGELVPHTAHTDHRILRRPLDEVEGVPEDEQVEAYQVFAGAEQRLPQYAVERARGLAMMSRADIAADIQRLKRAEYLMIPPTARTEDEEVSALEAIGGDVRVLNALAVNLMMQDREKAALECWQEVLRHDPKNEEALEALSSYYHLKDDPETTLKLLEQMARANPYDPDIYGRRAHVMGRMGQLDVAIESARMGVRLDPNNLQTQLWLGDALALIQEKQKSDEQKRKAERMQEAIRREHEQLELKD